MKKSKETKRNNHRNIAKKAGKLKFDENLRTTL